MNRNRQIKPDMKEFILEGVTFLLGKNAEEEPLSHGDAYLAERNTGSHLYVCDHMSEDGSYVVAKPENGKIVYPYDAWECRRVTGIKMV